MKRKLRFFFRLVLLFSIFFALSWLLYIVIWGELFQVQTIFIEANQDIFPDTEIFKKSRHAIFLDKKKLTQAIKSVSPWVDSLELKRKLPKALYIKVHERIPIMSYRINDQVRYISETSIILPALMRYENQQFPFLDCEINEQPGEEITDANLRQGIQLVADLYKINQEMPLEVKCQADNTSVLRFAETQVIFDQRKSSTELVNSLLFLFKQFRIEGTWPKSVDLRFEKPVLEVSSDMEATDTPQNQIY